nr:DUF2653 family protein [Mesobacillus maritimus]
MYLADKKQVKPEEVQVELMYDDDYGFSAETYVNGRQQILIKQNMIEALRMWVDQFLGRDPFSGIELILDDEEGIIALIHGN